MLLFLLFIWFVFIVRKRIRVKKEGRLEKAGWSIRNAYLLMSIMGTALIFQTFFYAPYLVPSTSMDPSVSKGDIVLVSKTAFSNEKIKRGDVVAFHDTEGNRYLVMKRVVGVPGDVVEYKDKSLWINGEKSEIIVKTGFIEDDIENIRKIEKVSGMPNHMIKLDEKIKRIDNGKWLVPDNKYFLMGDNRDHSVDSRYTGTIPLDNIDGVVAMKIFSWKDYKGLPKFEMSNL